MKKSVHIATIRMEVLRLDFSTWMNRPCQIHSIRFLSRIGVLNLLIAHTAAADLL
jgi:hypothetical protein